MTNSDRPAPAPDQSRAREQARELERVLERLDAEARINPQRCFSDAARLLRALAAGKQEQRTEATCPVTVPNASGQEPGQKQSSPSASPARDPAWDGTIVSAVARCREVGAENLRLTEELDSRGAEIERLRARVRELEARAEELEAAKSGLHS